MTKRQISIAFQTDKTAADYIGLAKLVNQFSFDMISVYCDAPFHPSYGPLFLMAPYLDHAIIGPAAVSPYRMHPIDIAANTALLATMVKDRVYIGISRGAWLNDFGIQEPQKPILGIKEALEIIQNLLRGEKAGYEGQVFNIANHVKAPYPLPSNKIPTMVGTWGKKLAELSGEIADDVKVGGTTNPKVATLIRSYIQRGIERSGREPEDTKLTIGAVTVVDPDRKLARKIAKSKLALYLPVVARLDPTVELESELLLRIQNLVNLKNDQAAGNLISDDLLEKFAFAGDRNDIIHQAETLFDVGVNRVEFGAPHGVIPENGIKILGKDVINYIN